MSGHDIHALSGAYALDALPQEERAFFERHLRACEACRHEVDEMLETAALLGSASAEAPPTRLREQLLAEVDVTRQLPPVPGGGVTRTGLVGRLRPLLAPVAAALAVAVIVLTGVVGDLNGRLDRLEQEAAASAERHLVPVLAAGDTRTVDLQLSGQGRARFLYSPSLDRGILVADDIAGPGPGRDFQLWLIHDGTPQPAAVFSPEDGSVAALARNAVAGAEVVAVTVEPRGGSPKPTGEIVASANL